MQGFLRVGFFDFVQGEMSESSECSQTFLYRLFSCPKINFVPSQSHDAYALGFLSTNTRVIIADLCLVHKVVANICAIY